MSLLDTIKARIGPESYSRIEKEAEKEVALAKQMALTDQNREEPFYAPRFLLGELIPECEAFERCGLKILPTEVLNVLFRCKLLFAANTEHEYRQRGGGGSFFDDLAVHPKWTDRAEKVDVLADHYISAFEAQIHDRVLLSHICSFTSARPVESPRERFEDLFAALGFPFVCFFDGDELIEKHKRFEPGLRSYSRDHAKEFFCAPSIGFSSTGSRGYCFRYSTMWLRTFYICCESLAIYTPANEILVVTSE